MSRVLEVVLFDYHGEILSGSVIKKEDDQMLVEFIHPSVIGTGMKYITDDDVMDYLCY